MASLEHSQLELLDKLFSGEYTPVSYTHLAAYCIDCVCLAVEKMTVNLRHEYKDIPIIYAGGVMSNPFIKSKLEKYGSFAEPEFSSDRCV